MTVFVTVLVDFEQEHFVGFIGVPGVGWIFVQGVDNVIVLVKHPDFVGFDGRRTEMKKNDC